MHFKVENLTNSQLIQKLHKLLAYVVSDAPKQGLQRFYVTKTFDT